MKELSPLGKPASPRTFGTRKTHFDSISPRHRENQAELPASIGESANSTRFRPFSLAKYNAASTDWMIASESPGDAPQTDVTPMEIVTDTS